jgi:hypothetical protein
VLRKVELQEAPKIEVELKEEPKIEKNKTPMTTAQRNRYELLTQRIFSKAERTFGGTAEDSVITPIFESPYDDEEVTRTLEIQSRGVTYKITVSAGR